MTVWTLAVEGSHLGLALGQSEGEVVRRWGQPSDTGINLARGHAILKYDDVELFFFEGKLTGVYCEFGTPPLPPAVESLRLQLEADVLQWPIDKERVVKAAESAGLFVEEGISYDITELRFGLATLLIDADDELAAWSVSSRMGAG